MRVSSSVTRRAKAGRVARSFAPSSAGSGMLQCTRSGCDGNSGHTSLHPIAQRDHDVEALRDELIQMLDPVPADVDPALLHHPHCVGVQRLRMAAGRRSYDCPFRHRLEQRLRDLRTRAVPGAQEQDPRPPTPRRPSFGVPAVVPVRATARDAARRPRLGAALGTPARSTV